MMADFCRQCSIEIFGEDYEDLKDLGPRDQLKPGEGWLALCEGCGSTVVDNEGNCIATNCPIHGKRTEET